MPGSNTTPPYIPLLIIAHGVLGVALFGINLVLYPPWDSLFYWWLAPFDGLCLLATALLALKPVRAWGCLLGVVCGGLETVALFYLFLMLPTGSPWPPMLLTLLALARLAAVWRITRVEMALRPALPQRGCAG